MRVFIIVLTLAVIVVANGKVPRPMPRISNGMTAKTGQLKYQVGLYIKNSNGIGSCGGALIGSTWILTAAHCIQGAVAVVASLGSTSIESGRLVVVEQWVIHPEWDQQTLSNDICLLRIPADNLGSNIAPVALPSEDLPDKNYVNEYVIASGWGLTSDEDTTLPGVLQYARLKVVPNSVCLRLYGPINFKESKICARGPGTTSTCKGDSGGPLVTESGVLVGITSYGSVDGCTERFPMAFTRVSSYRSWIKDVSGL